MQMVQRSVILGHQKLYLDKMNKTSKLMSGRGGARKREKANKRAVRSNKRMDMHVLKYLAVQNHRGEWAKRPRPNGGGRREMK